MSAINTFIYSTRPGIRILRHSLFWSMDILNYMIVVSRTNNELFTYFCILLLTLPLIALVTYFILYYLIPLSGRKSESKKEILVWLIALTLFLGIGLRLYKFYIVAPLVDPGYTIITEVWSLSRIVSEILSSSMVICMAVTIKLLKNKAQLEQQNDQLLQEKKLAELNFLKTQMQPHFLFNTLNTLYSETIQESGKAQQLVLHLSSLLRFILDDCNKPKIPIGHEIRVIKDFIALEQLRHGNRLKVDLYIRDVDPDTNISPLLFLPFVENSFKHTLNNKRGNIEITILISSQNEYITLTVENDLAKENGETANYAKKGIANTTRQLDLLYGKNYVLTVDEANKKYKVVLKIPVQTMLVHG